MATVSQLVETIAEVSGIAPKRVAQYARALINAGILPKSSGRAIVHVDATGAFSLLIAIASTDKPGDAARCVREYGAMTYHGLALDRAQHDDFLQAGARLLIDLKSKHPRDFALNGPCLVTITRVFPRATIETPNGQSRFQPGLPRDDRGIKKWHAEREKNLVSTQTQIEGDALYKVALRLAGTTRKEAEQEWYRESPKSDAKAARAKRKIAKK